jgi:BirA family transcriptional regulator, biotin operon repressor / biotin---[acetyl-CoA-carboxylase] ligase
MTPINSIKTLKDLKTKTFGRNFHYQPRVVSTNDTALSLCEAGVPEGTVVVADVQTKGRGRRGRNWTTTKGKSLALSIVLRPDLRAEALPGITLAAAVAVARTLEAFQFHPLIKWPNDILLSGKKVCGILTETAPKKDKIIPVILGLGINLNQRAADFPKDLRPIATSLYRVSRRRIDRLLFLQNFLPQMETAYQWILMGRFSKVLSEWRKRSATLGNRVRIVEANRVYSGLALGLDKSGALLVRNEKGLVERVLSGDVEVVKRKR